MRQNARESQKPLLWPQRLFAGALGCVFLFIGIWGAVTGVAHWTFAICLVLVGAAGLTGAMTGRYGRIAPAATAAASTFLLLVGLVALFRANFAAGAYMTGLGVIGLWMVVSDIRHSRPASPFL